MSFSNIGQPTANHSKCLLRVIFPKIILSLLMLFGGCRARQLARPTPQMDVEQQFWVRVLLLDNVTECFVKGETSFGIINPQTQILEGRYVQIGEPIKATVSDGKIKVGSRHSGSKEIIIQPSAPYIFSLNGNEYRGKLKLIINKDGNSFDAINLVPLEPYLAGVVGAEMPDYWEPAALQAQAIAARTYCLYYKQRFGQKRHWDVSKTQANQVYLGVEAESAQIWEAVYNTYGKVLVCKQSDGSEDIFPAYYSSTCGGHTENTKNVFGDSFEALAGVQCPYCQDVARLNLFFWPMVQYKKSYVTTKLIQNYPKLKRLGKIKNIAVAAQSDYGKFSRLTKIKLVGSAGKSDFLRAEDFRLTIDPTGQKLKSTICQIIDMGDKWAFSLGRGWGHGVGMCQCGAQGMARKGKTASEILQYYYAGSRIKTIY